MSLDVGVHHKGDSIVAVVTHHLHSDLCSGCRDVTGDGAGLVALDHAFHIGCFVSSSCWAQLSGYHSYAVPGQPIVKAAMWPPWRSVLHALDLS